MPTKSSSVTWLPPRTRRACTRRAGPAPALPCGAGLSLPLRGGRAPAPQARLASTADLDAEGTPRASRCTGLPKDRPGACGFSPLRQLFLLSTQICEHLGIVLDLEAA